ncbi:ABC transporter ATP-binding protein [Shewanella algae]|uniref:ABC transporter ATP-binding protein n=1 Tax=Shewanella algae TaxID=38313 RepID=UPI00222EC796|nr:ABC transporter ATP-binding protein [Shewanella algae]UZD59057.1 ABC transporter ATP-binding protein [Shewanella algae]
MPSIDCRQLAYVRGDRPVLEDISLQLPQGKLLALLGHNGAGKSTLIKLLLGLLKPAGGELKILGKDAGESPMQVGYLPENVSFYDNMPLGELLNYFAGLKGIGAARVKELLVEFELDGLVKRRLGQCSKGQRQRLGLAQALLSCPRLLLLDEPTVGLDPSASALMYAQLAALKQRGCTIVVCTHELALVEPHLDLALMLANGRMRALGSLDNLRQEADLPQEILLPSRLDLSGDPVLGPSFSAGRLKLAKASVPEAIAILTEQYRCFDFQLPLASLGELFHHFMAPLDSNRRNVVPKRFGEAA